MYSGKMVVFGQGGFVWAKMLYLGNWLYLGKVVVFGESSCIRASGCTWAKVVVFRKSGCFG